MAGDAIDLDEIVPAPDPRSAPDKEVANALSGGTANVLDNPALPAINSFWTWVSAFSGGLSPGAAAD
jgi:hypothetical protein